MRKYLLKHKYLLTILLIVTFLTSLLDLWKASLIAVLLDAVSGTIDTTLKELLLFTLLYLVVFFIITASEGRIWCIYTKKCLIDIKNTLMEKLLKKNYQDYVKQDTTNYLSNLTNDINLLERDYFQSFYTIIESSFGFVIAFIAIMRKNVWFIVFILTTFWIPIFISKCMKSGMVKKKEKYSMESSFFTNKLSDFLNGFEVIRIYGMEKKVKEEFAEKNTTLEEARCQSDSLDFVCRILNITVSIGIWMGTLLLGIYLARQGKMTVGEVLMVNQLQNNIVNPLNRFSTYKNKMGVMRSTIGKIEEKYGITEEKGTEKPKFEHTISFCNVSLELGGKPVLKDVTVTFEKNKKYALVGESGSGKSTMIRLLMKYYENYTGEILIDGVSLRDIDSREWLNCCNAVFQDVYIFQKSIKDNILLGRAEDKENLERVLKESCLESVTERLEEKENTMAAEHGKNFSGGERQRISIARALWEEKEILLLDEATSALDKENTDRVERKFFQREDRTVLAVLHKATKEQMAYFDQVIVMENGKISRLTCPVL